MAIEASGSIEGYTMRLEICHTHIGCEVLVEERDGLVTICPFCETIDRAVRLEIESRNRPHRATEMCKPPHVPVEEA